MCLAVPGLLVELNGDQGVVDLHGNRLPVNTQMTPEARPGDWLLVHAGFAIERLDAAAARETFAVLAELEQAQVGGRTAVSGDGGPTHLEEARA